MEGLTLNIWSVLIILGAVQGYVLAFGLWRGQKAGANRYLALLLLATSVHLTEYAIDISGLVLQIPHVFTASYPVLFMMGPFFYLYTLALFHPNFSFGAKQLLHFIPALLVLILFSPFYLQSAEEKIAFILGLGAEGVVEIPKAQFTFMFSHLLYTLIYVLLAWKQLQSKGKQITQISASTAVPQFLWIKRLAKAFIYYLGLYLLLLITLLMTRFYQVEIDYIMLLITASAIYAIGYSAIKQPLNFQRIDLSNGRQTRNVEEGKRESIKSQVQEYFDREKPFLNENLKLDHVADALNIPAYQLSEVLNESFGKNFFEFTNYYRVEEAKTILANPSLKDLKILAVAFDSGFGNKATFNRVFKQLTGLTPSSTE